MQGLLRPGYLFLPSPLRSLRFCRDPGSTDKGVISFSNALHTLAAFSIILGDTSVHPKHPFTGTERCLKFQHDCESSLLVFHRICYSGLNGPYLGVGWSLGASGVGVVHYIDGACHNYPTNYTFHAWSYQDSLN